MTNEEKGFIKNVNIDKARNKTTICILLSIISLFTYVIMLALGDFDFGVIFEIATLVFIIIARSCMLENDGIRSKRYIVLAMIPIGFLLIYDLLTIATYISNVWNFAFLTADFIFQEGVLILNIIVLFFININLDKANNPERYEDSLDRFYERLDKKDE